MGRYDQFGISKIFLRSYWKLWTYSLHNTHIDVWTPSHLVGKSPWAVLKGEVQQAVNDFDGVVFERNPLGREALRAALCFLSPMLFGGQGGLKFEQGESWAGKRWYLNTEEKWGVKVFSSAVASIVWRGHRDSRSQASVWAWEMDFESPLCCITTARQEVGS